MKLQLECTQYYRVKQGQTLAQIARAFSMPPRVLAACNGLFAEPEAGSVLLLPEERRNLYTVRGGESKSLLCGSQEAFKARNGTELFYPAQRIWL